MIETETGFLVLTIKEDEPFYISCSQGIVEVMFLKKGGGFAVSMRATNKDIKFHKNAERLRRTLGSFEK